MKPFRVLLWRLRGLFSNGRRRDSQEEIESHLQLHIDDNLRAGMAPDEARRQAVLRLGSTQGTVEACRDRNTLPLLENAWQDTRFAIR